MKDWHPDLSRSTSPRYMAIADLIEMDLRSGVLAVGDRLPPQRELARRLDIDFTTVARGYVEAQKRGLVESHVGRGTFVTGGADRERRGFASEAMPDPRRTPVVDFSMNLPPEPDDPELVARMREGMSAVATNLIPLLRYQGFGGAGMDKEAAAAWLSRRGLVPSQERIFVTPGAHPALLAIFGLLAKPGETVLSESITYPGMRSIAAQLRLTLAGLPMDADGILPEPRWLLPAVAGTGVYGGYFGAAQGVMLIALLGVGYSTDLHRVNAVKNAIAAAINGIAGLLIAVVADVDWWIVALMAVGSGIGGVIGGSYGRRLPPRVLRGLVVTVGLAAFVSILVT